MPADALEWNGWLEAIAPWDGPPRRSRATMIYTSGTTGRAKGVKGEAATPEQAAAYVELLRSVYGLQPGVRALIGGPLYHASPNAYARQALPICDLLVMQTRFDAEADVMAQLSSHPSIVSIFQADVASDGRAFLVMEYCPRPNLSVRCRQQPLSVPEALEIGVRISGAVEKQLNDLGIFHYSQIAELNEKAAHNVGEEVGLPGRVAGWVAKAKELTAE